MAEEKVFSLEEIEENPLPGEILPVLTPTSTQPAGTFAPTVAKDKPLPKKIVAHELLSSALNTKSKKILQEFDLQQTGGFKVGDFKEGISGDLRITPNGLTARNKSGITTLAVDGDTGDAIFAGQLRAGSTIVADTIITEESSNGNGRTVYLNDGIPAIVIGDPD